MNMQEKNNISIHKIISKMTYLKTRIPIYVHIQLINVKYNISSGKYDTILYLKKIKFRHM